MKVEEHNLKVEINEIIGKSLKTILNENCSVFRVMREEQFSPRGKAIMINNDFYEKILYNCNLCKGCEFGESRVCNAFQKARQVLVLQKKELPENKEIIKNLQKTGNIYGIKN